MGKGEEKTGDDVGRLTGSFGGGAGTAAAWEEK